MSCSRTRPRDRNIFYIFDISVSTEDSASKLRRVDSNKNQVAIEIFLHSYARFLNCTEILATAADHWHSHPVLLVDLINLKTISVLAGAIISVYLGYRLVAILGSALVAIGFFIASFISTDSEAPVQLLVGGLAGKILFIRLNNFIAFNSMYISNLFFEHIESENKFAGWVLQCTVVY